MAEERAQLNVHDESTQCRRRVVHVGDPDELDAIAAQLREQSRRHARGEGSPPTCEDAHEWAQVMPGVRTETAD